MKEQEKADHVTEYIKYPVCMMRSYIFKLVEPRFTSQVIEREVIEGHTPSQDLVGEYGNQRVLLLGSEKSADVARSYGFSDVISLDAYVKAHPYLVPYSCRFRGISNPEIAKREGSDRIVMANNTIPIGLILVFNVDDEYWKDSVCSLE